MHFRTLRLLESVFDKGGICNIGGKGGTYRVSGLRLGQMLGQSQRLTKKLFAVNGSENACSLPINIYGDTVVEAPILRLQLNIQIQKLKHKVKSLKYKSWNCKPTLQ